ncbi:hypothetical protein AGMMS49921_05080 [Endomicrobiia bacterium]|nr:hypothetical protein AGMMS49921_05080 [Endomicrobiia bacterium]
MENIPNMDILNALQKFYRNLNMKVMVSFPVYNRKEYLEITARSLYECSNIDKVIIKILMIVVVNFTTTI